MKNASLLLLFICLVTGTFAQTDQVKKAKKENELKEDKGIIPKEIADFLVLSADARMMDAREGKLAVEKGTTDAIRDYGKLMIKDQAMLLDKIRSLAAKKNVTLPKDISNKKEDGREDLASESGKDFDKKFIKMITIDHERDVKIFKEAIDFSDKDVKEFAKRYLPLIESHLKKSQVIKDDL